MYLNSLLSEIPNALWGFLGGCVTAILGYIGVSRQMKNKETEIAIASVSVLLKPLQERIEEQSKEIKSLKETIQHWEAIHRQREDQHRKEVERLRRRIKELENLVKKPIADR